MRSQLRLFIGLALVALAVLSACARESNENTNEGVDAEGADVVIEAQINDDGFVLPDEMPAGMAVFEVTNSGTTPHGFAIEGIDDQLTELGIDELATLRVELTPGTYVVYSPVDGDREAGLERELVVTEATSSDGAPLRDDAVGPSDQQDEIDDEGN